MDKIYCGNARKIETKYGEMLKLSVSKQDVNSIVKFMKDNNLEWCNINVKEKKNKEDGKPTHYLEIDQYKPDEKPAEKTESQNETSSDETDDLPF